MLKLIKGLFLFLLFGVVLAITLGTIFAYYFDANDYKEQIISYAEKQSNRSIKIATLDLTLFPSLGLAATQLQVEENPDFGNTPFLEAEEIQLGLSLLPLLRQEAQVDGIILTGIKMNVLRNERGQFNFDDLIALVSADQHADSNRDAADSASQVLALTSFGGINLKDGYLFWDDQLNGTRVEVDNLNLESGALFPNRPTPVSLNANINFLSDVLKGLAAKTALNAEVLTNLSTGDVKISNINMNMALNQSGTPLAARVNGNVAALELAGGALSSDKIIPMELDVIADGLSEDIKELGASLSLKTEILPDSSSNIIQVKNLSTHAKLKGLDEEVNLRVTAENNESLLKGDFIADYFKVSYGDIQLEGRGKFSDLYENPKADILVPAFNYDVWQFKQLALKGSKVGDRMLLNLQQAKFHQGQISANADLNLGSMAYRMKLQANEVPIDKIQAALSEDRQATVRGQARIRLDLAGTAGDMNQMLQSSSGNANIHITQGALQDKSLAAIVERIVAFLEGRLRRASGEELIFDDMRASVRLDKGIARNDDLAVQMPLLDVEGAGQVNLLSSKIDYTLHTRLKSMERVQVPIRISGNLESPKYSPDFSNLIKHQLLNKSKIEDKLKEKVGDVKQNIKDKIKGDLLEGLKDKLKLPF